MKFRCFKLYKSPISSHRCLMRRDMSIIWRIPSNIFMNMPQWRKIQIPNFKLRIPFRQSTEFSKPRLNQGTTFSSWNTPLKGPTTKSSFSNIGSTSLQPKIRLPKPPDTVTYITSRNPFIITTHPLFQPILSTQEVCIPRVARGSDHICSVT